MTGYLDAYGAAETERARRSRIVGRIVIVSVALLVLAAIAWFVFRNYKEEARIKEFIQLLQDKKYDEAYRMWGCTEANPCRDYNKQRFLEDWGPEGKHPEPSAMRLQKLKSCATGIIQTIRWGNDEILLWVNREDLILSFSPWPICSPRMKVQ
jgi:hypothetical protein